MLSIVLPILNDGVLHMGVGAILDIWERDCFGTHGNTESCPDDFKVKVKEEVRAQADEPTAAHTREKEKKERKVDKNNRSTSLHSWSTSMPGGGTPSWQALELREGSRSATLAPVSGVATWQHFRDRLCSRQTFGGTELKKRFSGCRKVQGVCRDVIRQ
jgi:hypothetical protein